MRDVSCASFVLVVVLFSVVYAGCGEVEVTVLVGRCAELSVLSAVAHALNTNPEVIMVAAKLRNVRGVFMVLVYRFSRKYSAKTKYRVDTIR